MILKDYKLIYADTNVVSNICKEGGIGFDFLRHFPAGENYVLCFSTYTLYELSKSETLMPHFRRFYALFPCTILISYFPLGLKEIEDLITKKIPVDPVLIIPVSIKIEGSKVHPDSLDFILQDPKVLEAFKNVEEFSEKLFLEYSNLLEKEEFKPLINKKFSRNQFIDTFKKYELKHRFFSGKWKEVDETKLNQMKSLDVLAQGLYYKFYSDFKRKISISDVIDILIMTTAPYCHTFISEGNSIDIYKKIVSMNKCGISSNYMTIAELKK
jgi:hypothetical protein